MPRGGSEIVVSWALPATATLFAAASCGTNTPCSAALLWIARSPTSRSAGSARPSSASVGPITSAPVTRSRRASGA